MKDIEMTPRQREFRQRQAALLAEFAREIGPEFGGAPEGHVVAAPMCSHWLLVALWEDAESGDGYTVQINSGMPYPLKVGLLEVAGDMARADD